MSRNLILFVVGSVVLTLGITLVLKNWMFVVMFFKGLIGMALAVAGLVILMLIKDEKVVKNSSPRRKESAL